MFLHCEVDSDALGTDEDAIHFTVGGLTGNDRGRECVLAALTALLAQAKTVYGEVFVEELLRKVEFATEVKQSPELEE